MGGPLPPDLNWAADRSDLVRDLALAIAKWEPSLRARTYSTAERISEMTDEAGQTALFSVVIDRAELDELGNGYARAVTVLLDAPAAFRRAEEVRYTDEKRNSRMWDGFRGDPGRGIRRDGNPRTEFEAAIKERFESPNVHVDIYDRTRPAFEAEPSELIQVTVYREGRLDDELAFVDGTLDRRPRRPVLEAAITYDAGTGVTEVVAADRQARVDLVRLFARHLQGAEFREERIGLRLYDLRQLMHPHPFPVDAADGIEEVRVVLLRLVPLGSQGKRLTLECARTLPTDIWAMAQEQFGDANPLLGGWFITQAKLIIKLRAGQHGRAARILPLNITYPRGCDLRDRSEAERMIGERYLRRWGLIVDV
jgi:hypothetical protein